MAGELAGARVLLLSASDVTRELLKVYLAEGGAEVVEASDARGLGVALGAYAPQVALVDLGPLAPAPSEVLPLLAGRGVDVLAVAGRGDEARAAAWRGAGAGVLQKPLAPEEVLSAVAALLAAHR
jgi:DNA-binding response OmpR family regulator